LPVLILPKLPLFEFALYIPRGVWICVVRIACGRAWWIAIFCTSFFVRIEGACFTKLITNSYEKNNKITEARIKFKALDDKKKKGIITDQEYRIEKSELISSFFNNSINKSC